MRFGLLKYLVVFVAACSAATQIPFLQYVETNRPVSAALFSELEELSRIVDISYCVGVAGLGIQEPFECPSRCKDFEGFELVTTWNTGPMLSDSCGYIALSHPPSPARLIVAFRGTYSITNTIADLSTIPQEYVPYPGDSDGDGPSGPKCGNCSVHIGFYTSWLHAREEILPYIEKAMHHHPNYSLTLVGHSLGGAVATLASLELLSRGYSPTITTFGEPRLGNQAFVDYVDMRFNLSSNGTAKSNPDHQRFRRVTHISDPVPQLPLEEWGYVPHGGEIFISKSGLPPEVLDVYHCDGSHDQACSVGPRGDWEKFPWGLPARLKMWQLFFAHRDYFWRLGLCIPEVGKWLLPYK